MELKRNTPLKRSPLAASSGLSRTPMRKGRSVAGRRMAGLRRTAYQIVDGRSGGRCEVGHNDFPWRCTSQAEQHHHRRPRRSGGSTAPETEQASNIVALCGSHHARVESNRDGAYRLGLLVRAGHEPTQVPVLLHVGWTLLDPEGHYLPYERENR